LLVLAELPVLVALLEEQVAQVHLHLHQELLLPR
jgi:hypothetical protein